MANFEQNRLCRACFITLLIASLLLGFISQVLFSFVNHQDVSRPVPYGVDIADARKEAVDLDSHHLTDVEMIPKNVSTTKTNFENAQLYSPSLLLSAVSDKNVPNLVKSWRAAKLDWHTLLPLHNSIWERFGTPKKGEGLQLLVSKEQQVTNFLTQFDESGLSAMYGKIHGPLLEYSACNSFLSACMIHDVDKCKSDQLCSWSSQLSLCVDKRDKSADPDEFPQSACPSPMMIGSDGVARKSDPSQCLFYVNQPAVFVEIDTESQSMFYHWWASWSSVLQYWRDSMASSRQIHIFVHDINDSMFFEYFGFISDNCWRRSTRSFVQVPPGACFCNTQNLLAAQCGKDPVGSAKQILDFLDLNDIKPPQNKIKIGLISRRSKRFILNEYELVAAVEAMGYVCVLLPLESMTLFEQMKELRSVDVLIGIHGSALDNSVFLHPGETELFIVSKTAFIGLF
jgi:Glycosyltransferase 61